MKRVGRKFKVKKSAPKIHHSVDSVKTYSEEIFGRAYIQNIVSAIGRLNGSIKSNFGRLSKVLNK